MNRYMLEFSIASLWLQKKRTIFLTSILASVVFLFASVLYISSSLEYIQTQASKAIGEITISKEIGGRFTPLRLDRCYTFLNIDGVSGITPRIWGMYRFHKGNYYFSIIGLDKYDYGFSSSLKKIATMSILRQKDTMVIGKGVKRVLQEAYYPTYLNFLLPSGGIKKITIAGVFHSETQLLSNDTIILGAKNARLILGLEENEVSDCIVHVKNKEEIPTIAEKIKLQDPTLYVQTKEQIRSRYQNLFDFKSGLFLSIFSIALFTFFMIVYERISSLSSQEKKEIAILKAIGWSIEDIIKQKMLESFLLASFAYIVGITFALVYVFILQAPLLRDIFTGFDTLKVPLQLTYHSGITTYMLLFFVSVVLYIGAVIIPTYKTATLEVDEVLR